MIVVFLLIYGAVGFGTLILLNLKFGDIGAAIGFLLAIGCIWLAVCTEAWYDEKQKSQRS